MNPNASLLDRAGLDKVRVGKLIDRGLDAVRRRVAVAVRQDLDVGGRVAHDREKREQRRHRHDHSSPTHNPRLQPLSIKA